MEQFLLDIIAACRLASEREIPWVRDVYCDRDGGYCALGYYLALRDLPEPFNDGNTAQIAERYGIDDAAVQRVCQRVVHFNDECAHSFDSVADYLECYRKELFG